MTSNLRTPEELNQLGASRLPGLVGMEVTGATDRSIEGRLSVRPELLAPNGFLHGATVIALADTCCGYGTLNTLPDGATGFTTVELKANFLGTVREGTIHCVAKALHLGRSTQLWDATVCDAEAGRTLAHFRCTQLVLWPRPRD
jgi:uncharacterized protein (TIGR00369 family)